MSDKLKILRRSATELLALAVCSLFPKVQIVSGEATSLGFYYDFFSPEPLGVEQLSFIEERMRDFMRRDLPIKVMEMMRKNAIELFKHHHQDLKVALLKGHSETLVHVCQIEQFYDTGYPPFVETTKHIGVIKLLDISNLNISLPGRPNLLLTRIQGIVCADNASLRQFLKTIEAAKQSDHRLLGKEMKLFTTFDETCPGCISWYPKGTVIREMLIEWWRNESRHQKYQMVSTPHLVKPHVLDPRDSSQLRFELEGQSYTACSTKAPLHALIFKSSLPSYRELPMRYCELSEFYNRGGEANFWGLLHTRAFTADSSYVFCTSAQVLQELISSLQFINKTFKIFGFEIQWHLLSKSQESKDFLRKWDESQDSLVKALNECDFNFTLDKEEKALYGPTVEMRYKDALGREWKGPYVYIDLYHPEKFGLLYQEQKDRMQVPVMMGRSMFGSIERLIGILIEHYVGKLPLWLVPEQVRVIPVGNKNVEHADQIVSEIEQAGFRTGIDYHQGNLRAKIHTAEKERVPYMVIVGDKEEKNKTITLRRYLQEEVQNGIVLQEFLKQLNSEVKTKA